MAEYYTKEITITVKISPVPPQPSVFSQTDETSTTRQICAFLHA